MSINTYAPSDVDLLIDGFKIKAWESIELKRDTDSYTFHRGIRGKNVRTRNYNKSVLITLTVLQTSEVHDVLSEIHRKDTIDGIDVDTSTADSGVFVVTLKDRSGTTAFQSEDAYIVGLPAIKFTQDFETRIWQIQCHTYNLFRVGGNLRPTTNLIDSIFNKI